LVRGKALVCNGFGTHAWMELAMSSGEDLSAIVRSVTVPVAMERAFEKFVQGFSKWWPGAYTWSGDVLQEIGIEAKPGGHCFEIGPGGFRCDWGTVQVFEEPERLLFTWQINFDRTPQPDAEQASSIDVSFKPHDEEEGSSQVTVRHFDFERCGADAAAYRAALDSPEGWTFILQKYITHCSR
jgi:uncharacterized protein YndB with AHSA1/START domain